MMLQKKKVNVYYFGTKINFDFISIWFYRRERTYAGGNRPVSRYWAKGSRADGSARASDSAKPAVLQRAEKSAFSAVMHRFCRIEQDIINI